MGSFSCNIKQRTLFFSLTSRAADCPGSHNHTRQLWRITEDRHGLTSRHEDSESGPLASSEPTAGRSFARWVSSILFNTREIPVPLIGEGLVKSMSQELQGGLMNSLPISSHFIFQLIISQIPSTLWLVRFPHSLMPSIPYTTQTKVTSSLSDMIVQPTYKHLSPPIPSHQLLSLKNQTYRRRSRCRERKGNREIPQHHEVESSKAGSCPTPEQAIYWLIPIL